jgi:hypothetical protein
MWARHHMLREWCLVVEIGDSFATACNGRWEASEHMEMCAAPTSVAGCVRCHACLDHVIYHHAVDASLAELVNARLVAEAERMAVMLRVQTERVATVSADLKLWKAAHRDLEQRLDRQSQQLLAAGLDELRKADVAEPRRMFEAAMGEFDACIASIADDGES